MKKTLPVYTASVYEFDQDTKHYTDEIIGIFLSFQEAIDCINDRVRKHYLTNFDNIWCHQLKIHINSDVEDYYAVEVYYWDPDGRNSNEYKAQKILIEL